MNYNFTYYKSLQLIAQTILKVGHICTMAHINT